MLPGYPPFYSSAAHTTSSQRRSRSSRLALPNTHSCVKTAETTKVSLRFRSTKRAKKAVLCDRARRSVVDGHLVILLVVVDGGGMGQQDVMSRDVGFPARVAAVASTERRGAVVGRVLAQQIGELGEQVRLVERRPVLDPVAERPEAHVRVVVELLSGKKKKKFS